MKRIITILCLLVLTGALLAACSCPAALPTGGGTLNLYNIDPYTLDPATSSEMTSHNYIVQLFGGLLSLDDDLEPVPDIAESWRVSDDGRTYTFSLREDARFHDGRAVTAGDFKYSWQRACDPATGSITAATYLGDIVGAGEMLAGAASEISGVRVIDNHTLEVTIDTPRPYFLYKLTYPTTFVVDRANVEQGTGLWHQPNGTGPFRLMQWTVGSLLILERNELYYGEVAKLEAVVFHLWAGVPVNLYETGKIDVAGISLDYIDRATDTTGPFYQELQAVPELSFYYLGFDTTKPPFDDPDIRRAFSLAVDKDKLASLVFKDMVLPADGILPPDMPGYNENLAGLGFDAAAARELIANSRYGGVDQLPPITITTIGWGGLISSELEAILHEWRQNLGVEVSVRQLEPERFMYYLAEERDELFYMGWVADYPHPQDFLEILFHSTADANYGGYSNPEVDALLEQAGLEPDAETSLALYRQAEQLLVADAACLPLWFGQNYILVKPYVNGYDLSPSGIVKLNEVSVEPD